jgi:ribosomal protein S18 acetylase RimI-like enzyme
MSIYSELLADPPLFEHQMTQTGHEYHIGIARPTPEAAVAFLALMHNVASNRYVTADPQAAEAAGLPVVTQEHIDATFRPTDAGQVRRMQLSFDQDRHPDARHFFAVDPKPEPGRPTLLGVCQIIPDTVYDKNQQPQQIVKIDEVDVLPTVQKNGIGSHLLHRAATWISETHGLHEAIGLEVIDTNTTARKLYDNLGFKELGSRTVSIFVGAPKQRWVSMSTIAATIKENLEKGFEEST